MRKIIDASEIRRFEGQSSLIGGVCRSWSPDCGLPEIDGGICTPNGCQNFCPVEGIEITVEFTPGKDSWKKVVVSTKDYHI